MKESYKFYRLVYSVFAALSLGFVVWYHFHITGVLLWNMSLAETATAAITGSAGLIIMGICIKKYFIDLSGIDVLLKRKPAQGLQVGGLHKFVRHPLYSGTLLFVWSVFLWQPLLSNLISCICITAYTLTGIYFEEKKLVQQFGEAYKKFAAKTAMLIPGLF